MVARAVGALPQEVDAQQHRHAPRHGRARRAAGPWTREQRATRRAGWGLARSLDHALGQARARRGTLPAGLPLGQLRVLQLTPTHY